MTRQQYARICAERCREDRLALVKCLILMRAGIIETRTGYGSNPMVPSTHESIIETRRSVARLRKQIAFYEREARAPN